MAPRYWEVEDTTLDSTQADLNMGWQPELDGGEGKTILIQFKGLDRVLGPNKHITKASLVFSIDSGDRVALTSIGEVQKPWNQGPVRTLLEAAGTQDTAALWSATWRHRRAGVEGIGAPTWDHAGALGPTDTKTISGATCSQPDNDHIEIDGLAEAVQHEYEQPATNHGFMLRFSAPIGLVSSEFYRDQPHLVLQYEDAAPVSGPDLDVTYIERKPEYARYIADGGFTTLPQDGVPVPVLDHPQDAVAKKWPIENEDLIYIAHVRNAGNAPVQGFTARWYENENADPPINVDQTLQPGEETTLLLHRPYKSIQVDHRVQPLGLEVIPKGVDTTGANNFLEIQESGLNIGIYVEKGFYDRVVQQGSAAGAHSFEDWIQEQVGLLNNVYFPFSRFSFATDGARERVRVQRIKVVADGSLTGETDPNDLIYDTVLKLKANDPLPTDSRTADLPLLRALCEQLGLPDWSAFSVPANDSSLAPLGAPRGTEDLYPGLMGSGDTRDEALLEREFSVGYQPYNNPLALAAHLESTDLLSGADVSELNTDLGKRRGFIGDVLYDTPTVTVLQIKDYSGNIVPKAKLTFYQMAGGKWNSTPAFSLTSNDKGIVSLPNRETQAGKSDKLVTDHDLRPNPFGRIDFAGGNGTFMVKAEANGAVEWAPLKVWQLVDAYHRGQPELALMDLAFNLPSDPLDEGDDIAKGRGISCSDPSAKLDALVDGRASAEVTLPSAPGSWVEIDLGRDRTIGEVRLATRSGHMWNAFQIKMYETAQKPSDALLWTSETNWTWSFRNRPDITNGVASVAYRGPAQRVRYIRIISTGDNVPAELSAIQVIPIKQQ